jgi:hypothetical protein
MEAHDAVQEATIPLVSRPFWVYQRPLPADGDATHAFNSVFAELQEGFQPAGDGPLGVCVIVPDRAEMEARPEAVWPDTELIYAGYTPDDRQVRIRFFWGAKAGPGVPDSPSADQQRDVDYSLEERYRIERLSESPSVTPDDVLALWARENAVSEKQALRRIHEVQLVAITGDSELVGVSSVYLERNAQLRIDMWNYRTFVASAHRMTNLAAHLLIRNRDLLESRFTTGEDARAQGVLFDLQNEGLKKHMNNAYWPATDFTFIGENRRNDHVRVHYFPGARVPLPAPPSGYH